MGIFSDLVSRKRIAAQGKELAAKFMQRLPQERVSDAKRVAVEFEILAGTALEYRRKDALGLLGTSQLVNSFQWAMIESGYEEAFAREIGNQLAVKLAAER